MSVCNFFALTIGLDFLGQKYQKCSRLSSIYETIFISFTANEQELTKGLGLNVADFNLWLAESISYLFYFLGILLLLNKAKRQRYN